MTPTRLLLVLASAWFALGVVVSVWPAGLPAFMGAGALLAAAVSLDVYRLRHLPPLQVTRLVPPTMALGERYDITLTLQGQHAEHLRVHDHAPQASETSPMPQPVHLPKGRETRFTYQLRPLSRGLLTFAKASIERTGPLGLVHQHVRLADGDSQARVFPNFRMTSRFVGVGEQAGMMGMHLTRMRGTGLEFHQLREYREGDSVRQIDWKSVARRHQLISREYRSEQNQQVLFMVDTGRRMRAQDGELSLLDQSLNALLLLTYVALKQGDSVGVLTFGADRRYLPPVRGAQAIGRVLDVTYDLESSTAPSDFEEAVARLNAHQHRRALVVVLTSVGDDVDDALFGALRTLRPKHMVVVADLRDPELFAHLQAPLMEPEDGLQALSLMNHLAARRDARERLQTSGLSVLESEPSALPPRLVDHYMRAKRSGAL